MKRLNYHFGFHRPPWVYRPTEKTKNGFWCNEWYEKELRKFSTDETDEIERLAFISNKQADKTTFEPEDFHSMDISGIHSMDISGIWNSNFSGFRFNKSGFYYSGGIPREEDYVDAEKCFTSINFRKTEFSNCMFNCGFIECSFSECVFKEGCVFEDSAFHACNFSGCSFGVDTLFINSDFEFSNILEGTNWRSINCESVYFHNEETFLEALEGGTYFGHFRSFGRRHIFRPYT